jgi:hypothetical protein
MDQLNKKKLDFRLKLKQNFIFGITISRNKNKTELTFLSTGPLLLLSHCGPTLGLLVGAATLLGFAHNRSLRLIGLEPAVTVLKSLLGSKLKKHIKTSTTDQFSIGTVTYAGENVAFLGESLLGDEGS